MKIVGASLLHTNPLNRLTRRSVLTTVGMLISHKKFWSTALKSPRNEPIRSGRRAGVKGSNSECGSDSSIVTT
jgi:hypothetical protein